MNAGSVIHFNAISNVLLFSTVQIKVLNNNGTRRSGTGFFYKLNFADGSGIPLLITNSHLLEDNETGIYAVSADIRFHQGNPDDDGHSGMSMDVGIHRSFAGFPIENFRSIFKFHPNPDIDLCAAPLAALVEAAERHGRPIFRVVFLPKDIPDLNWFKSLSAVEDILMIGYPIGLFDEVNNLPLIRKGITSTHPGINFCGRPEFVIDAACFPGSSGSPVLRYRSDIIFQNGELFRREDAQLLGVLTSGPYMLGDRLNPRGSLPLGDITNRATPHLLNLGYVVRATEIHELAHLFLSSPPA